MTTLTAIRREEIDLDEVSMAELGFDPAGRHVYVITIKHAPEYAMIGSTVDPAGFVDLLDHECTPHRGTYKLAWSAELPNAFQVASRARTALEDPQQPDGWRKVSVEVATQAIEAATST